MITPDTLHIRCGSDIREALALGGIPGDYLEFSDPVCQGPLPPGMVDSGDALIERRAHFIAREYGMPLGEAIRKLKAEWEGLKAARERDSLVLWFEHDLYDQTVLIRILSWLRRNPPKPGAEISLVTIDRHPEVEDRFIGLGQLSPTQLAALAEKARACGRRHHAGSLRRLGGISVSRSRRSADAGTGRLPQPPLSGRPPCAAHLQELPWTRDGLSLTERLALRAAAFRPAQASDLFKAVQQIDPQPFLGDVMFNAILRRLEVAPRPALTRDNDGCLSPTRHGEALLAGMGDWIDWNSPEHWVGAVDLANDPPPWRWDDEAKAVVR